VPVLIPRSASISLMLLLIDFIDWLTQNLADFFAYPIAALCIGRDLEKHAPGFHKCVLLHEELQVLRVVTAYDHEKVVDRP